MEKVFIEPAVNGTLNILKAAQKANGLKRVVITSSVLAIIPWSGLTGSEGVIWDEQSRIPTPSGPYSSAFEAYGASKVAAHNETEEWVRKERPTFDVV